MIPKYNATITVRGKGVTSTKRINNKPMPFIVNTSKQMADHVNHMEYVDAKGLTVEMLDKIKYKAILSSINIKFKRVK